MIQINDITKKYGNKLILDHVTLHISPGEIFGLIGPNGAGKSTLLSILATVLKPTSGSIFMNNKNIVEQPDLMRKWIGYVPQDIALFPMLTVWDNLKFWAQLAPSKTQNAKLIEITEIMHLNNVLRQRVRTLSGGMKRKLNIAVALLHNPKILILDEPTVGIDNESKREIVNRIKQLGAEGATIVYTSHNAEEIFYLCERVAILNNGFVQFNGAVEDARQTGLLAKWENSF